MGQLGINGVKLDFEVVNVIYFKTFLILCQLL